MPAMLGQVAYSYWIVQSRKRGNRSTQDPQNIVKQKDHSSGLLSFATKCIMKPDRICTCHSLQLPLWGQLLSSYIKEKDRLIWEDETMVRNERDEDEWLMSGFSLPWTFANLYTVHEKSTQKEKMRRRMKSEWFSLIASTTLPTRFKGGAGRRGETEKLMGTEQGPVIFQKLLLSTTLSPRREPDPWSTESAFSSDAHMHTRVQTHN